LKKKWGFVPSSPEEAARIAAHKAFTAAHQESIANMGAVDNEGEEVESEEGEKASN